MQVDVSLSSRYPSDYPAALPEIVVRYKIIRILSSVTYQRSKKMLIKNVKFRTLIGQKVLMT